MRNQRKIVIWFFILAYGIVLGIKPFIAESLAHGSPDSSTEENQTVDIATPQATQTSLPSAEAIVTPSEASNELSPQEIIQEMISSQEPSRYTLGIDDVIEISVMRHPEVTGQYVINSEGKIQYEFVGDVPVVGLTKEGVKKLVVEKLSTYIVSPDVTVKITGYNSKVVYVIGEVGRPGKISMHGDTITVREALLEAGLPLLSASTKKSRLITPSQDGNPQHKIVNVEALLYEGDLREDLVMKPGDTLYIPATVLAKAMRMISPVSQPIGAAAGTGRAVTTGF